jgi:rubrerythrin
VVNELGLERVEKALDHGIVIAIAGATHAESETGRADALLIAAPQYMEEVGDPATGEPVGDTSANLKSAIAGETYEYTKMYPGFAKTAREEGFQEIAEWFETLARAEKSHAGRFQKALDTLQA